MPANIGEMFYYGALPWHEMGTKVPQPLTVHAALKAAGLEWQVEDIELQSCEEPASPVTSRKGIARADRPAGHPGRVLGVVHHGFSPIQNKEAAAIFDSLFGHGQAVYHTGGYLNDGQVIWLLAKLDRQISIGSKDDIQPYALMVNSHDGSYAFSLSLTTIRVVCQNTINFALQQADVPKFRRAHRGTPEMHRDAATGFWKFVIGKLDWLQASFQNLAQRRCEKSQFERILDKLFPIPSPPSGPNPTKRQNSAYQTRCEKVEKARKLIARLRESGMGSELATAKGTLWGVLNAITEYVDHHHDCAGDRLAYALLGSGSELKAKAYRVVQEIASHAA